MIINIYWSNQFRNNPIYMSFQVKMGCALIEKYGNVEINDLKTDESICYYEINGTRIELSDDHIWSIFKTGKL